MKKLREVVRNLLLQELGEPLDFGTPDVSSSGTEYTVEEMSSEATVQVEDFEFGFDLSYEVQETLYVLTVERLDDGGRAPDDVLEDVMASAAEFVLASKEEAEEFVKNGRHPDVSHVVVSGFDEILGDAALYFEEYAETIGFSKEGEENRGAVYRIQI